MRVIGKLEWINLRAESDGCTICTYSRAILVQKRESVHVYTLENLKPTGGEKVEGNH